MKYNVFLTVIALMDIKQKQTDIKESNTGISKHRNPRDGADREPKRERKGEMLFTKSVPIVIFIFHLLLSKRSNVPNCTKIAQKMQVFFRKLFKI